MNGLPQNEVAKLLGYPNAKFGDIIDEAQAELNTLAKDSALHEFV